MDTLVLTIGLLTVALLMVASYYKGREDGLNAA